MRHRRNWLLLHRLVGKHVSRHERGYDAGIVLYPLAVLLLVLIFRHELHFAAIGWALLAFGDGFATLAGKSIRDRLAAVEPRQELGRAAGVPRRRLRGGAVRWRTGSTTAIRSSS